ncbi:hypothetical protein A3A54_02650 [Candidatus Curtissbacteria bacterium RIFCSPLOWO2_01_FULL_39_62]|uniref:DUF4870 domain-containing protein n=2 Tax=Candidatus Curtissiibacteriota TaxID=1752717 RepID=A0A1F5GBN0_9BACT|nr:MAG: hypothetical protein A2775_01800 [Candidatus Curtissbacteria bacterium RIFCSPHIGHO2_01_FULL_39_57]OGD89245.1 MAG: hypothetical protein A3D04_01250 [Candidatus Curtissbacteria bacterium RIFCSPHIGHO2_02_FULL_40_16b]OGD99321.1 MAG: hypothetical protein A3J17_00775 [Candidatus Curtissbacteria bacterium RIFCSPLOWO2_02_FULL_40_11]OGE01442.1 MAG: hypothetical protein A3A54_02650 [Candidatus Curtissbacteria bacterium RIFCSPLOWO2_01_FULL_39_62]OGE13938.1 MAG: hypothetical protein A3G14_04955 [Ca
MSSSDQNRNLVAAMAYLLFFVTGIVILMVEQEDKFVRFHAMQSTLVFGGLFILNLVFQIGLDPIAIIGFLGSLVGALISIVAVVIWLVSMIKAYQGQMLKWPIVGKLAENWVK